MMAMIAKSVLSKQFSVKSTKYGVHWRIAQVLMVVQFAICNCPICNKKCLQNAIKHLHKESKSLDIKTL
jgi:Pyruvate/2-oxoacid:ferredoxin oxidoreductase delta subunit